MNEIEERIETLGYILPESSKAMAMYIPSLKIGNILYISGQGPFKDGQPKYTGKVGKDVDIEYAQDAARLCVMNLLAAVKAEIGSLDSIERIVNLTVFVNSSDDFEMQHVVANAASELLYKIFGDKGRHTRTAVGVNALGLGISVEIAAIIYVK